jgi:cell division protein FtsL
VPAGRGAAAASSGSAALAPARRPREEAAERPNLGVVERQRSSRRVRIALTSTVGLVFGSMFGLAAFHSVLVQGQLHLDKLDQRITAEQQRQTELRLQVAQLGAPQRVVVAAGDLGMVTPDNRVYLAAVVPGSVVPPPPTTKAPRTSTTKAPAPTAAAPAAGSAR